MRERADIVFPDDVREFTELMERLGWDRADPQRVGEILGCRREVIRARLAGERRASWRDLDLMRALATILDVVADDAEDATAPIYTASESLGEDFAEAVLAFGWDVFDDRIGSMPPFFSEVSGLDGARVRLMATGQEPILRSAMMLRPLIAYTSRDYQRYVIRLTEKKLRPIPGRSAERLLTA